MKQQIQLSDHFTYGKLLRFTIPSIIMMVVTSIYGVVDGLFVSNVAGSEAFAALNLIMPVLMILGAIGFMLGTGGSALVAKTLGEGKIEKANRYFSMIVIFTIIMGIAFSIIGFIFMRPLAKLLGAEGEILEGCVIYGRTLMISLTGFMLQNEFQSFLIVAEHPRMGLVISILCGVSNIIGDFLLVYVLDMGLLGAALATALGELIGGLVPLIYFIINKKTVLHLCPAKIEWQPLFKACFNGSSEMLSNISMSIVNMLYNMQLLKIVGSDGVVAYGIIMYINFIFVSSFIGYSIGTAAITGYHYGAANTDELKNIRKKSYRIIICAGIVMFLSAELLAGKLAGIFVSYSPALMDMTTTAIRIFSIAFLFNGISIYTSNFFTALNNGPISALISFLRTLVFQVSMIFLLPVFLGLNGVWFSIVVAEILSVIVSLILLALNKKKYQY